MTIKASTSSLLTLLVPQCQLKEAGKRDYESLYLSDAFPRDSRGLTPQVSVSVYLQFTCFTSTSGVSLVALLVPEHLHETAEGKHVACAQKHLAVLVNYYTMYYYCRLLNNIKMLLLYQAGTKVQILRPDLLVQKYRY